MTTNGESGLTLATLPSDIIRTLIRMQDYRKCSSVRLIAPRWNSLVLNARSQIYCLDFHFVNSGYANVTVRRKDAPTTMWAANSSKSLDQRIVSLLRYCTKINKLVLINLEPNFSERFNNIVRQYIGCRQIGTLCVSFDDKYRKYILDMIQDNSVQHLQLSIILIDEETIRSLITEAMQSLQTIRIIGKCAKFSPTTSYFRLSGEFWHTFAQELNDSGDSQAQFFPDNEEMKQKQRFHIENVVRFHVQKRTTMPPHDMGDISVAYLPPKVMKMILKMNDSNLEALAKFRLISPQWNTTILEVLRTTNNLVLYFGNWEFPPHLTNVIVGRCFAYPDGQIGWPIDNGNPKDERTVNHIQCCAKLDKLELRNLRFILPEDKNPLREYLRNIPIGTVELINVYSFAESSRQPMLDLIRVNSVQHLHMNVNASIDGDAIREFIIASMIMLESIKIRGRNSNDSSSRYFGLPREFGERLADDLNNYGTYKAWFYPDNTEGRGYHTRFQVRKV